MKWLLTGILAVLCLWLLGWGMRKRGRIFEYPFLVAIMGFSFVLPQMPALASDPFLPEGAYEKTVVFTILCFIMARLGWSDSAPPLQMFRWVLNENRLLIAAAVLSMIG